ncbi:MAG: HAD family hydrolase [Anaerolineae bacterium]|nr:HAD family hydrolase [Anaerolineae bacterium]
MLALSIPGKGDLVLRHIVLDVNGTLAIDGCLIDGVAERLDALKEQLEIHLLTADTHGKQAAIDARLGFAADRVAPGGEAEQKAEFVERLGGEHVIAVGNGANDAGMLRAAAVGIAVLGPEGLSSAALQAADVIAPSILNALDMLLVPGRMVATLRR